MVRLFTCGRCIVSQPDLSIIIPTLNEMDNLPLLLADLEVQQGLSFEVIVSDGGSVDGTASFAESRFAAGGLSGVCLQGPPGRGRQLNAGASSASSSWLLFLHADSRLYDRWQLRKALDFIGEQAALETSNPVAGRFSLRFAGGNGFGLFYCEVKADLGRPGCIHGDQGLLLAKAFFEQVGPFREDLPVLEDTCLAERIREQGQWFLLPGKLVTSPRRFEAEGFRARQTLNALLMNCLAIGWLDIFSTAPDIYRQQKYSKALLLAPFFGEFKKLFKRLPVRRQLAIWLATGSYVRSQAWQIGLYLDCRKAYRLGKTSQRSAGPWLSWFDRWFEPLTDNCFGRTLTAVMVWLWFARQAKSV